MDPARGLAQAGAELALLALRAAEGGVDAVTIDGVHARCGASVGSIYHHFGNRDGIVAALFFGNFDDPSRSVQVQLDAAQGAEAGVQALVTGYLDWGWRSQSGRSSCFRPAAAQAGLV